MDAASFWSAIGAIGTVAAAVIAYLAYRAQHQRDSSRVSGTAWAVQDKLQPLHPDPVNPLHKQDNSHPGGASESKTTTETPQTICRNVPLMPKPLNQQATVDVVYAGSSSFTGRTGRSHYSNAEIMVDGPRIGEGDLVRGFNVPVRLKMGKHKLRIAWVLHFYGSPGELCSVPASETPRRTDLEFELEVPGKYTLNLGSESDVYFLIASLDLESADTEQVAAADRPRE